MNWLADPRMPDAFLTASGPYQVHVYLRDNGEWQWTIFCQPARQSSQQVALGLCRSCAEAQTQAETKLEEMRRPGRLPKARRTMTAAERNKQRVARLAAKGVKADVMNQQLDILHNELGAAGHPEWADRVARIRRSGALRAIAEYTRRNATFFVTSVPRVLDPKARAFHIEQITALAGEIDALAGIVERGDSVAYSDFEVTLRQLHRAGFFPDSSLVSEVARTFG